MDMNIHVYWHFAFSRQFMLDLVLRFAITSYLSMLNFNMIQAYVFTRNREKTLSYTDCKKKKDRRDVAGKYCLSVALNNS